MSRVKARSIRASAFLEKDHQETSQNLTHFYGTLKNLHSEGKLRRVKNLFLVETFVQYFTQELTEHMQIEEDCLFPFLKRHIPRLEPVIFTLLAEHGELRACLRNLKANFSNGKSKRTPAESLTNRVYDQGIYLLGLLRSHMMLESLKLYKAVDSELHPVEKRKILDLIRNS